MPNSHIILRKLHLDDAQALQDIHQLCFPDAWSEDAFQTLLMQPLTIGWLALQQPLPIGFILARLIGEEAEVLTFAVLPRQQGKGVGESLLTTLLAHLQASKVKSLFLEVSILNHPAQHLYQKLGFTELTRRLNYFPHLTDSTAIVLRKAIEDSIDD